jgi:hypothetical protein|tara:strand:- start:825 stop:1271 length:447 start_codon:yes stop_codon:yes gene_type:complete
MATTTATITLSSADLLSDNLSLSTTMNLNKGGTTATGLDQFRMERFILPTGDGNVDLIEATTAASEDANYVYLCNKNTDATHYVIVSLYDVVIGRLYAGDWMFMPWDSDVVAVGAGGSAIEVRAYVADATLEYCLFHNGETRVASDDS